MTFSLSELRNLYKESRQAPPLGDYDTLLAAFPTVLDIVEAAHHALMRGTSDFVGVCDIDGKDIVRLVDLLSKVKP
jgi:hypothetical protein